MGEQVASAGAIKPFAYSPQRLRAHPLKKAADDDGLDYIFLSAYVAALRRSIGCPMSFLESFRTCVLAPEACHSSKFELDPIKLSASLVLCLGVLPEHRAQRPTSQDINLLQSLAKIRLRCVLKTFSGALVAGVAAFVPLWVIKAVDRYGRYCIEVDL